jgi:hypothetical protein
MEFGEITFRGAVPIANNGLLVAGDFTTPTRDIGGHVMHSPTGPIGPNGASFVAALDNRGALRWVSAASTQDPTGYVQIRKAAATRDGAVICGEYAGSTASSTSRPLEWTRDVTLSYQPLRLSRIGPIGSLRWAQRSRRTSSRKATGSTIWTMA